MELEEGFGGGLGADGADEGRPEELLEDGGGVEDGALLCVEALKALVR